MNNPEYVKVNDKKYKINTDFRVALKCNEIAEDTSIGNLERALAIIYTLYGDEGLNNPNDYEKLLELAQKYLLLGKEPVQTKQSEIDMDFMEDMPYIEASFMSDYNIDLTNRTMHWWTFYNLISGLSNSELGNCCVLNRIRNLRTYDVSKIKDAKEKDKILKAKKEVELKKNKKEITITDEQKESIRKLNEILGI